MLYFIFVDGIAKKKNPKCGNALLMTAPETCCSS